MILTSAPEKSTAAVLVGGVRRGRQVGAVDRRAAGRVRDDHPVAEELADQLEVGGLAAAVAGERELEERLEDLRALHGVVRDEREIEAVLAGGSVWAEWGVRVVISRLYVSGRVRP